MIQDRILSEDDSWCLNVSQILPDSHDLDLHQEPRQPAEHACLLVTDLIVSNHLTQMAQSMAQSMESTMLTRLVELTSVLQVQLPLVVPPNSMVSQSGIPVNYWMNKLPNKATKLSKLVFLILYTVFNTKTTNLFHIFIFKNKDHLQSIIESNG